jgi:transcriptional regulator with XRE-family HTH domain
MLPNVENYAGMPGTPRRPVRKLYLHQWLTRLGKRPVDLANHLNVTESYISNLKSEKRSNPSIAILLEMSEWLGITVNDLFVAPPKAGTLADLKGYSPAAVAQLISRAQQ